MIRILSTSIFVLASSLALCSCTNDYSCAGGTNGSADNGVSQTTVTSMATVAIANGGYVLIPDAIDGVTAYALANPVLLTEKKLNTPGQRLLAEYRGAGDGAVLVMRLREVLTKDLTNGQFPTNDAGQGSDDVYIQRAWLGGGYLNVIYRIYYSSTDAKHTLDARLLEKPDSAGRPVVEICHHANGDGHDRISAAAYASFRLNGPTAKASSIRVNYVWNDGSAQKSVVATQQGLLQKGEIFF